LELLQPFVEVRAIAPNIGLGLALRFADIGGVGEILPNQARKEGDAFRALRRFGFVISRRSLDDRAEGPEVIADQRVGGLAVLDRLLARRRPSACARRRGRVLRKGGKSEAAAKREAA